MLWETGSPAHQKQHSSQPGPSLHSEPTNLLRNPSPLPSTQSSHTLKTTTPTSECCLLISAQYSIQSPPWNWLAKLSSLGLSTTLYNWMLDFLTNRPQTVWIGGHTSSTLVLNTGAFQGCMLSPLLFMLYTHDPVPDMERTLLWSLRTTPPPLAGFQTMMRLHIGRKSTILQSSALGTTYCPMSEKRHTHLSTTMTLRWSTWIVSGSWISITKNLSWSSHISTLKKAQKLLYFLRKLKKAKFPCKVLVNI